MRATRKRLGLYLYSTRIVSLVAVEGYWLDWVRGVPLPSRRQIRPRLGVLVSWRLGPRRLCCYRDAFSQDHGILPPEDATSATLHPKQLKRPQEQGTTLQMARSHMTGSYAGSNAG